MLSVAIIGAGRMGTVHANAFARLPGIRVAAIVDPHIGRSEALAARLGAQAHTDLATVLDDRSIQVVTLCSPPRDHYAQTLSCADAGKHILCEKPMACSIEEADAMIEAIERASVHFMVAHVLRFWPEYEITHRLVAEGQIGRPLAVYTGRLSPSAWWKTGPHTGGGVILGLLIHDADFCNWLLGRPERVVAAQGLRQEQGDWRHLQTLISYPDAVGSLEASYAMPDGFPSTFLFRVLCEDGAIEARWRGSSTVAIPQSIEPTLAVFRPGAPPEHPSLAQGDPYAIEIAHFVRCLEEGRPSNVITPAEARNALAVALAVRESLDEGRPVDLAWGP